MPWLETSPVEQRERFIADHRRGLYTMTELCARYGISRKSGYKWLERFEEGGRTRAGARRSSWTGSRRSIPASPGPPSVLPATCSLATAW